MSSFRLSFLLSRRTDRASNTNTASECKLVSIWWMVPSNRTLRWAGASRQFGDRLTRDVITLLLFAMMISTKMSRAPTIPSGNILRERKENRNQRKDALITIRIRACWIDYIPHVCNVSLLLLTQQNLHLNSTNSLPCLAQFLASSPATQPPHTKCSASNFSSF